MQVLIRFDNIFGTGPNQIPPGQSVFFATLSLSITGPGNDLNLHRMLVPWEDTVTWNELSDPLDPQGANPDDVIAAMESDALFPAQAVPTVIELPVSTIQAWLDGTAENYGWAMIPTGTDGVDFDSSEASDPAVRPKLTVVWGTPGLPFLQRSSSSPQGVVFHVRDGEGENGKQVDPGSISLAFDGVAVESTVSKEGDITTIHYASPGLLAPGSNHSYSLSFADTGSPPNTQTEEKTFTVAFYSVLLPSLKVQDSDVDKSDVGFNVSIHQSDSARPTGNFLPDPITQARGELADDLTGGPRENLVDTFYPGEEGKWVPNPSFTDTRIFHEDGVINYNQDARATPDATEGNFGPDKPIPGVPGITGSLDQIAAEITTFLELQPGLHRMVVNSDDGFVLSSSLNPRDALAIQLGLYDGGRGAADSTFEFAVEEAGLYPFTLHWWEGGGGANVEWFSVDPVTGEKTLINDTSNDKAIRAYRSGPSLPPYAQSASPAPGQTEVPTDANIEIVLMDTDKKVQVDSVKLSVNGESVTPQVGKSGGVTTVSFDPPANFQPESVSKVRFEFSDGTTATVKDYSFRTAPELKVLFAIDDQQTWRYNDSGADLGTAWREPGYDDSSWQTGFALLGFESGATAEPLRTELNTTPVTFYFRTRFNFDGDLASARLRMRHVVDDGAVCDMHDSAPFRRVTRQGAADGNPRFGRSVADLSGTCLSVHARGQNEVAGL